MSGTLFFSSRSFLARLIRLTAVVMAVALTGCATAYVDATTKEINSAEFKKPAATQPVQLLFEFQTKGAPNGQATELLKKQITEQVQSSGLFSMVDDKPVNNGAILSIALNNVPVTDDAFSKGFVTGMTFGLVGSQVTDGYVCTVKYLTPQQPQPITKAARHAIHAVIGAGAAPPNGVKAESIEAAVRTMTRQVLSTALNDLSRDVNFK